MRRIFPIMVVSALLSLGVIPPAQAVPWSRWERIAQCESGGNWHINTGNGYYGGLQFSLASWRGTGGSGYPHHASKAEQIKRANILASQIGLSRGWPVCSQR